MRTCSLCMRNVLDSSLIIYPFNQVSNNYCYQHPLQMPLELEGVLIVLNTGGQIVIGMEILHQGCRRCSAADLGWLVGKLVGGGSSALHLKMLDCKLFWSFKFNRTGRHPFEQEEAGARGAKHRATS